VAELGALVEATVDVDAVLEAARSAAPLDAAAWDPQAEVGTAVAPGVRVAVAGGAAFTFSYAETAELLAAAGAEVTTFDPLRDPALPAGTRAVVLGGGFPEVHAEALAANTALVRDLAAFEGPIVAECAGLLYLGKALDGVPMAGRLDVTGRMTSTLTLGYRRARAVTGSCVGQSGEEVRGHEFHRTVTDPAAGACPAWAWDGEVHGFVDHSRRGSVHASYLHTHWAGTPRAARRLVEAAA
jgi:cobyrinic acid a,c-diamide synthase